MSDKSLKMTFDGWIKFVIRVCLLRGGVCEGCLFCDTDEDSKFSCVFSSHSWNSWSETKLEKYAARIEKARREPAGCAAAEGVIKAARREQT